MDNQTRLERGSLLFSLLFVVLALFLVSQLGEQAKFSSKGKLFAQPAFWPGVGVIGMAFFGCLNLFAALLTTMRKPQDNSHHDLPSSQGSLAKSSLAQGSLAQGSLAQGSMAQGSMAQGSMAKGSMVKGSLSQRSGSEPQSPQSLEYQADRTNRPAGVIASELKEGVSWLRALEYLVWFMLYVYLTPIIGYLAATVLFLVSLTFRAGYRERRMTFAAVAVGFAIVLIFKSFLGVKIPGGAVYEPLPDALRSFMIINF